MKGNSGTRLSSWRDKGIQFKGSDLARLELTDSIDSYNIPVGVDLQRVHDIKTYDDLKAYLKPYGIELTTELDKLSKDNHDVEIDSVREICQKIALGIDTYKYTFGDDALSSLKRIVLYSDESTTAAYYYSKIGEIEPLEGTVRFKDFRASGSSVFHELAHAFQDSHKMKGEDAVTASTRLIKAAKLDENTKAYFGARDSDMDAERMAQAIAHGFTTGKTSDVDFIKRLRKIVRKP